MAHASNIPASDTLWVMTSKSVQRRSVSAVLAFALTAILACGAPQPPTDEQPHSPNAEDPAFLNQVADVARATTRVRYDFTFLGTGALAGDFVGTTELEQIGDVGGSRLRVEMRDREPQPRGVDTVLASDGERVTVIDHTAQTAQIGSIDGAGSSLLVLALYGSLLEFVEATPFAADLDAGRFTVGETREINGRPCREVEIRRDTATISWCFDSETHLPVHQVWTNAGGLPAGTMDFRLTKLERPTTFATGRFRPTIPDGYAIDDVEDGPIAIGSAAPPFELPAAAGGTVSLSDYVGRTTVVLFWASWCSNCHRIMDELEAIADDYRPHGVEVVGISAWEQDNDAARAYAAERGPFFTHLLDGDAIAGDYAMTALPGLYVIGPDGLLLMTRIGPAAADMAALRSLLHRSVASGS